VGLMQCGPQSGVSFLLMRLSYFVLSLSSSGGTFIFLPFLPLQSGQGDLPLRSSPLQAGQVTQIQCFDGFLIAMRSAALTLMQAGMSPCLSAFVMFFCVISFVTT
jgi:hypothetical protein